MNTIKLTERELKNIGGYEPEKYFDGFIFDEYKIIIKYENFKVIYKVKFEDDINKVVYRIIKGTEYKNYEFSFVEDREKLGRLEDTLDIIRMERLGGFHLTRKDLNETVGLLVKRKFI